MDEIPWRRKTTMMMFVMTSASITALLMMDPRILLLGGALAPGRARAEGGLRVGPAG